VVQTLSLLPPATHDDNFVPTDVLVSNDTTPPRMVWANVHKPGYVVHLEIAFSEPMDATAMSSHLRVLDSTGATVVGSVQLFQGGTVAVFTPSGSFRFGELYSITLTGATDQSGNPVVPTDLSFRP